MLRTLLATLTATAISAALAAGGCGRAIGGPANQQAGAGAVGEARVRSDFDEGNDAFAQGRFEEAASAWRRSAETCQAQGHAGLESDARVRLAGACEMLGQYDQARRELERAVALADQVGDVRRQFVALNALGAACTLKPDPTPAEAPALGGASPAAPGASLAAPDASPAAPGAILPAATRPTSSAAAPHVHGGGASHDAKAVLNRALALATGAGDRLGEASVYDNLGNLYTDRREFHEALDDYARCVELAVAAGDSRRAARGSANAGVCALADADACDADADKARRSSKESVRESAGGLRRQAAGLRARAGALDADADRWIGALLDDQAKVALLLLAGQTDERTAASAESAKKAEAEAARDESADDDAGAIAPSTRPATTLPTPPTPADLLHRAGRRYRRAIDIATAIGDQRDLSYATGYLGHIVENRAVRPTEPAADRGRDLHEALDLSRRAVFSAQQAGAPESLYRWEWQVGRLLADLGDSAGAIAACQRAVQTVGPIRPDIALGNGNQRGRADFRQEVGRLYFQLADLLLRQPGGAAPSQATLVEARDTVESLKSAELEDYLRDECVPTFHSADPGVHDIEPTTAIVYFIPLPDRIELLAQFGGRIRRYVTPIGEQELAKTTLRFRRRLTYVATEEYRDEGRTLYRWLIRPMADDLRADGIDTLVFVPDGVLRTVPMAALVDGDDHDRFLIEKFAVGVVPALSLTTAAPRFRVGGETSGAGSAGGAESAGGAGGGSAPMLINGLSEAVGKFPALPFVPVELRNVKRVFADREVNELLNDQFRQEAMTEKVRELQPSIVHIASHGQFGSEARETFILTYDRDPVTHRLEPLTLDGLERLVRVNNFKGRRPVDLLVLSACQTAAGDDRAALGLGGVAVKSGARSAVATLWSVNDESSTQLISDFYRQLHDHPRLSMAHALQAAQVDMIHEPTRIAYHHPYFWAPYLMIGNWR